MAGHGFLQRLDLQLVLLLELLLRTRLSTCETYPRCFSPETAIPKSDLSETQSPRRLPSSSTESLEDSFYKAKRRTEERKKGYMTITVDDAGSGDLLYGIVIGAYRDEPQAFSYDIVDVKYFQASTFRKKEYLTQTSKVVNQLLIRLQPKPEEEIHICQGYIFDEAVEELRKIYGERIQRIRVTGEPQRLVEIAYCDEIRNLGYEPLPERDEKRAKNFFHMMRWLKENPGMMKYAKTGWPRLSRYPMFKPYQQKAEKGKFAAVCADCGKDSEVPFKPDGTRPVYCKICWTKKKASR
jgi:CxxC-x17-CxxC domain-containing protein